MDIVKEVGGNFDIQIGAMLDLPKIMVLGKSKIFVENYLALAEYKRDSIKLVTRLGMTELSGENFEILEMKQNNIAISGRLGGIKLI